MWKASRILEVTILWTMGYALVALALGMWDERTLGGANVWHKPLKFGVSTSIYLATLLWAARMLSAEWREGRVVAGLLALAAGCTVLELVYIGVQAGRGEASHFNLSTPFHAAMYTVMAVGAVALVASGAGVGVVFWLDRAAGGGGVMRWGVGLSFVVSTILTVVTALTMGARLNHHAGMEVAEAARVPVLGWSLTVGDLRVPHFLATHLMQGGPLFAWMVGKMVSPAWAVGATVAFCALWTGVTLLVFQTVLAGRPFWVIR